MLLGSTVLYTINEDDVRYVGQLREHGLEINNHYVGLTLAADVVRVWSDECVNLFIKLDGQATFWKMSVTRGLFPGQWRPREEVEN